MTALDLTFTAAVAYAAHESVNFGFGLFSEQSDDLDDWESDYEECKRYMRHILLPARVVSEDGCSLYMSTYDEKITPQVCRPMG